MATPFSKKFMKKFRYLLILLVFCNSSCINSKENIPTFPITAQEKVWLEKFFRYFLFYEPGVYTLLGSKPITEIYIAYEQKHLSQLTNEEIEKLVYFELNRDDESDMLFYKRLSPDQKKKAILISGKNFIYHVGQLWNQWEKIQCRFPLSKKFLLIKKERLLGKTEQSNSNIEKIIDVMFVNIFQTAFILQNHYDLFKRAVGFDFDPLQIVFELENEDSEFWKRIQGSQHSYLWGLLHGFGEKNTWGYFWKGRHIIGADTHEKEIGFANVLEKWSTYQMFPSGEEKNAFSISNFPVPAFASFSETDPVVIQYEKEREIIKNLYKGKDFVQFTLYLLSDPISTQTN